jgi:hypothetical protein
VLALSEEREGALRFWGDLGRVVVARAGEQSGEGRGVTDSNSGDTSVPSDQNNGAGDVVASGSGTIAFLHSTYGFCTHGVLPRRHARNGLRRSPAFKYSSSLRASVIR